MGQVFRRSGIYMRRWHWWFPWTITEWWEARYFNGGDEWCNDSACFVVPPFGAFIIFWCPGTLRTLPCLKCWHETPEDQKLDYAPCGYMWNGRIRQNAHHHWGVQAACARQLAAHWKSSPASRAHSSSSGRSPTIRPM
jgi:hypothetical protein